MIKHLYPIAILLTAGAVGAQIQVTSLDASGRLSWNNLVPSASSAPIYTVLWSSNLNGAAAGFLRVTNQTHALLTNYPSTTGARLFYRVLWENGQVWNMNFYSESTLVAAGKIYIPTQTFSSAGEGRYEMRVIHPPGAPLFLLFVPRGRLVHQFDSGWPPGNNVSLGFRPDPPAVVFDDDLWLEGPIPTTEVWTGHWYESGIAGIFAEGEFVAQKIPFGR